MTRQEMRKMGREMGGIRWAVEEDYRLHEIACSKAKNVVAGEANQIRVQRSWGTLGEGIHWKATLAAMARGEKAMYVKRKIHKRIQAGTFNEYTPMVFLFSEVDEKNGASTIHDSNIAQRHIELGTQDFPFGKFPPPDEVYSVFLTSQKCEGLWGYHVQRESLTSISFLYNRCSLMGPMRHETINKRPKRYQCRITPQQDEELQGFPLSELGVAWAVKYAEQAVIVAAYSGWKPSSRLLVFARKRQVEVVTVPLSILSPEMVKRLRYIYFISTPLKKHPEREKIVKRFLY